MSVVVQQPDACGSARCSSLIRCFVNDRVFLSLAVQRHPKASLTELVDKRDRLSFLSQSASLGNGSCCCCSHELFLSHKMKKALRGVLGRPLRLIDDVDGEGGCYVAIKRPIDMGYVKRGLVLVNGLMD